MSPKKIKILAEDYILMNYELCNYTAQIMGVDWLKSDPEFLCLLASLTSGRLHVIMEEPYKVIFISKKYIYPQIL